MNTLIPQPGSVVGDKKEAYRLYEGGFFGNKLTIYPTVDIAERADRLIGLRYAGAGGGQNFPGYTQPTPPRDVRALAESWVRLGADPAKIKFSESAPDHQLIYQGEVRLTIEGTCVYGSTEKTQMRKSLANLRGIEHRLTGLRASFTLRHYLCGNSQQDMEWLMERYPDSVIEFSTYDVFLGNLPRRNTVIWEVRNY